MIVLPAISTGFLLVFCATVSLGFGQEPTSCNAVYNNTDGKIVYSNATSEHVPASISCTWNITSLNNKPIFLVFDHLYLMDGDSISISSNGKELYPINLTNIVGALPYLTGEQKIMVTLNTTKDEPSSFMRTFVMHYYTNCTECSHSFENMESGQIHSPLYDPKSSSLPATVSLKVLNANKELHKIALWFEEFVFSNGSIQITGTTHDGKYDASNRPAIEFLGNGTLEMKISLLNGTKDPELFVARYDAVSSICSENMKVTDSASTSIQAPSANALEYLLASNQPEANCRLLLETDAGKTLSLSTKNVTLPGSLSQFLVLDGPNRNSPALFDMNNQDSDQLQAIFSSGNYLWISTSVPSASKNFMLDLEANQTKSGGHMREGGQLQVTGEDKFIFLLEVSQNKQVQLVLNNSTVLKDSGSISFYKDFLSTSKPFLTMTSQNKMDMVESPTGQMAVVTSGFKTSVLNASFTGVEEGCFKYGDGSSGTFSVTGHCNSTCGWMIEPMPSNTGLLSLHFQSLKLSGNDRVIIRMMDASQTQIANISSPTCQAPDLWLPAATGAFVQVMRSDCNPNSTVIQSNYQTSQKCAAAYAPKIGETVTISSAGYPNHYPLGDSCIWTVEQPANSSFLHLSFVDLQLAKEDHVLEVYEVNGTQQKLLFKSNGTDKNLPMDMPVKGQLLVNFTTKAEMPLKSLPGFSLTVTSVGMGEVLTNSSGEIETPSFPSPVNGTAFYVWLVQINSTDSQKEIVEFSFKNGTNFTDLQQNLKIYDGATLRSEVIQNFTSSKILSRTNQLIFTYQSVGSTPGPAFSVSYQNFSCNMSLLCNNGFCMHEDWKCNGINDCGDFSDEKNCRGSVPPPAPIPPSPPSGDGNKGVSTAALAVGILIALVIGAILGVGAPAAFKRLRGNRFQSYSSFTNNIE